jgi:hypothetical protein
MPRLTKPAPLGGSRLLPGLWLLGVAVAVPGLAHAYVGPGLGLGAIMSFLALIGAVFLGILGFLWYPIKRLIRSMRRRGAADED